MGNSVASFSGTLIVSMHQLMLVVVEQCMLLIRLSCTVDSTYLQVLNSSGSAMSFRKTSANFRGSSVLMNNTGAILGGAVAAIMSSVSFTGYTLFKGS